ncbi:MAG: imidazole glycerol phosphate synthase subunit HisF [Chloroflexota bacterium]|nr:imidazole glycerol phosphate synthase subunit HisF [Chloroflexota bacterium]
MLTKRIIPCMDVRDGRVVKNLRYFTPLPDAGDPVTLARAYNDQGADELVYLDITASVEARKLTIGLVQRTADEVFIPLTVAGGISTVEDMNAVLHAGADNTGINTAAATNPPLISEGALRFGSQCIVVAIDAKHEADDWWVYTHGGRTATGRRAVDWAHEAQERGAGEILLTSMDRDGTGEGYDIALLRDVADAVSIPVIASGGASRPEHFVDVVREANVDAVLAASMFHYGHYTVTQAKEHMRANDIPVRLPGLQA